LRERHSLGLRERQKFANSGAAFSLKLLTAGPEPDRDFVSLEALFSKADDFADSVRISKSLISLNNPETDLRTFGSAFGDQWLQIRTSAGLTSIGRLKAARAQALEIDGLIERGRLL
jgi:hypothetical protein